MSDVLLATSFTICAPMFSSASFNSISFATVTPSLVIVGEPNFLSRITLRPFGPRVTLTPLLLLFRRVRDDDRTAFLLAFFEAPNDDPIMERSDIHDVLGHLSSGSVIPGKAACAAS